MFIDEAKIYVKGGDGGNGCISTHREIYMPKGGPDGGNGGRGGNIIFEGSRDLNTLQFFRKRVHVKGKRGAHGGSNNKFGRDAEDTIVKVPLGTVIYEDENRVFIGDVIAEGQRVIVAAGGRGGRGNAAFATRNYRVPRFAEKGEIGEERWLRLELRLIAHVGLIGLPNAGKSTFLSAVTSAKPKIADYPFTTLSPNLGVVERGLGKRYIFADIPGLIKGASEGAGLGHQFLRHISRTKVLIHMIDLACIDANNPMTSYDVITEELKSYDESLVNRPFIVAANKSDIPGTEEAFFALEKNLKELDVPCYAISAASGEGLEELLDAVFEILKDISDDFVMEYKPEDFVVIDETTENISQFWIEQVEDYFVVHGKSPERMVQMTDLENDEGVYHLQMRLKRMGVEDQLKRRGAKEGDTVVVSGYEFTIGDKSMEDYMETKK